MHKNAISGLVLASLFLKNFVFFDILVLLLWNDIIYLLILTTFYKMFKLMFKT